jgi:MarR family 2-MHQ and catechol resistance regulon transcriptional repressor
MSESLGSPTDQLSRLEQSLFQLSDVIRKHQIIVQQRFNVTAVEVDILKLLEAEGDKKMKDIGESVHVKLSNLTNIVDRLEEQKLVKRVNSKEDRRSIFVHVTSKGKKLLDDYASFLRELTTRMQESVQAEQFKVLLEGLEKISQVEVPESEEA